MAGFNLDDYEPVDARIKKAMADIPEYRMVTELVSPIDSLNTVVFRASFYMADTLLATGYATETAGDGYVNKTSHLENCETSAIGRALANYGYSGDKRPSKEEMVKATPNDKAKRQILIDEIAEIVKTTIDDAPVFTDEEKAAVKGDIKDAKTLKALSNIRSTLSIKRDQRLPGDAEQKEIF